jgi:hypothetical protein
MLRAFRNFIATVLAALCLSGLSARSDDIPTLDVNPVCRGIASQGELEAGLQQTSFQQCVQSEQSVRDEIKKEWSLFRQQTRLIALPCLRQEENRVTPSSSPVWKCRAMSESCTAKLTSRPHPSERGFPRRWVIASRRRNSVSALPMKTCVQSLLASRRYALCTCKAVRVLR